MGADTRSAEQALDGFGKKVSSTGQQMTALGAGMTAGITLPLLGIAAAALSTASDFEQNMNILQQVSGATGSAMDAMQAQALELGAVTSFSAGEAAEGMLELAKAGMSTEDVMSAIPGAMDLAAAGGVSLAEAAGLTAATLNAFHLEAAESARVADLLAGAANASAADISDLGTGMQQAGFAFSMANQPVEALAASLAILTNVGLTGSDAGTALKNAFMRMMNPTKEANSLMKSLGISFYDAQGNMKALPDIIDNLNVATAGLSNEQRDAALSTIFLSDGMKAMIPLMDQGKDGFDEMVTTISKTGAATDVANARMKGLSGGIEYLKGSVDSFLIGAALPFLDTLGGLARGAADALTAFGNLPQPIINASLAFAGILAVMGPILLILPTLAAGFALLTGPVGLTVLAIAGLGAAWAANVGGIQDVTATAFASVQLWFTTTATALDTLVTNIGTAFDNTEFPTLESLWTDFLAGDFETIATKIKDTAFELMVNLDTELNITGKAEQLRKSIATGINNALAAAMKVDFSGAKASFDGLRTSIQTALSTAFSGINVGGATAGFGKIRESIQSALATAFSGINVGSATAGFSKIRESIQTALATAFSSINASGVSTSLSKMRGTIENALSTAFGSIQASGAMAGLTSLGNRIKTSLDSMVTAASGFDFSATVTRIKTGMGQVRDGILSGLTSALSGADWSRGGSIFAGMINDLSASIRSLDFSSINWTTVFQSKLMGPLSTAINGIKWVMSSTQFGGLLTAVTGAIGTIKWGELGTAFGGLTSAVVTQLSKVGQDMVTDVTKSLDDTDWTTVSLDTAALVNSISADVTTINWEGMGSSLATKIKGVVDGAIAAYKPTENLSLAQKFDQAFLNAWNAIDFGAIGTSLTGLSTAWDNAQISFAKGFGAEMNIKPPQWVTDLETWAPGKPGWVTDLTTWKPETVAWVNSLINWKPTEPAWVAALSRWASDTVAAIAAFDWTTWIDEITWPTETISAFAWTTWVHDLIWPTETISGFSWTTWISDLIWPTETISAFSWTTWVDDLTWPTEIISAFDWSTWIADFSWPSLPSFSWSTFVPRVNWSIPAFPGWSYFFGLFGEPPTGDGNTTESDGSIGSASSVSTRTMPTTRTSNNTGGGSNGLAGAGAGDGGITINVNVASIANDMNLESLAYNLATKMQQRTRR